MDPVLVKKKIGYVMKVEFDMEDPRHKLTIYFYLFYDLLVSVTHLFGLYLSAIHDKSRSD